MELELLRCWLLLLSTAFSVLFGFYLVACFGQLLGWDWEYIVLVDFGDSAA